MKTMFTNKKPDKLIKCKQIISHFIDYKLNKFINTVMYTSYAAVTNFQHITGIALWQYCLKKLHRDRVVYLCLYTKM